jgi:hypothetical protein
MAEISQWLKDARAWTSATKGNQAQAAFGAQAPEVQQTARKISDLYEGMRYGAEDNVDQYDARSNAARTAMMGQFDAADQTVKAGYGNSQNYLSEIAKRLGLQDALQGPAVESQNQQMNQMLAMNNVNRTNQQASYDLLKGGYGELLRDRLGSFDVQAGTSLANLLAQMQMLQSQAGGSGGGGGGGGGRGGGGRSGKKSSGASPAGFDFMPEQSSFIAMNPYNPPSGSTYSSDYVRPDVVRPRGTPVAPKKGPPSSVKRINAAKSGAKRPLPLAKR